MRCKAVLLMDHSASFISAKNKSLKVIVMFIAALMTFLVMTILSILKLVLGKVLSSQGWL